MIQNLIILGCLLLAIQYMLLLGIFNDKELREENFSNKKEFLIQCIPFVVYFTIAKQTFDKTIESWKEWKC